MKVLLMVHRWLVYYSRLEREQPLSEWQRGRKSAFEAIYYLLVRK